MRVSPGDSVKSYSSHFKLSINTNKFTSSKKEELANLIFEYCSGCLLLAMSAIPQGVFAAQNVRKNMEKNSGWKSEIVLSKKEEEKYEKWNGHTQYPRISTAVLEHPPLKYNSKLMNSIWGLYNKYSVHNFKKNTDGMNFL